LRTSQPEKNLAAEREPGNVSPVMTSTVVALAVGYQAVDASTNGKR
jgi:hypothetical protein